MRPRVHGRGFYLLALLPLIPVLLVLAPLRQHHASTTVPLSTVLQLAVRRDIARALIATDGSLQITTRAGRTMNSQKEPGELLAPTLTRDGAQVSVASSSGIELGQLVDGMLVLVMVGALLALSRRELRQGRWPAPSPGLATEPVTATGVMFTDVAGVDEAKAELAEVVAFLSAPGRFRQLGARIPRGVLLSGPPGTGKTLLARAVAGEAHVPFFSISGSAFVEMYVGVGASRVRAMFARARKSTPCIVFIDELDAIGGRRGGGHGGSNEEREHTLNQLLVEMDGFGGDTGVVVIAATNRPDMLDTALLRPGRFDRRVTVSAPDRSGRKAVLALHARRLRLENDVDLDALAGQTSGMTPADLANLLNEAALLAARMQQPAVGWPHLDAAFLRLLAGPELRSRVLPPSLKRVIAYHEAGHALVMKLLPHCDPVAKVQAIARGNALGITVSRPAEDQYLLTKAALQERLAGLMGGRAAEEIIFGEVTTGAQQDIQQASAIARRMVTEFGMSRLGHICVGEDSVLSPELAWLIDQVTRELVEEAYARAQQILESVRPTLVAVAERLCAVETIDGDELDVWLQQEPACSPAIQPDAAIIGGTGHAHAAAK